MTTIGASLRSAARDRAARAVGEHDAVGQPGERVGQREPAAGERVRPGALDRQQREREQRDHRERRVDGQDRERREAEQDALVRRLAHELAGELVADARARRERDDGRHRAGVDDEVHAGGDERRDELAEAEVAVARAGRRGVGRRRPLAPMVSMYWPMLKAQWTRRFLWMRSARVLATAWVSAAAPMPPNSSRPNANVVDGTISPSPRPSLTGSTSPTMTATAKMTREARSCGRVRVRRRAPGRRGCRSPTR